MGHYRIYQLDPSDDIAAAFSVECGSDTAAMRAARTLLERSAGVEVWKSSNRLAHLSTGRPWPGCFTEPMVGLGGNGSSQ